MHPDYRYTFAISTVARLSLCLVEAWLTGVDELLKDRFHSLCGIEFVSRQEVQILKEVVVSRCKVWRVWWVTESL